MKPKIHPEYHEVTAHCACGNTWKTPQHPVRAPPRDLLPVPPVLHGEGEAGRHGRTRRALPEALRQGDQGRDGPGLGVGSGPTRLRPGGRTTMIDKLAEIERKYLELKARSESPEVASDHVEYAKAVRAMKEIAPIVREGARAAPPRERDRRGREMLDTLPARTSSGRSRRRSTTPCADGSPPSRRSSSSCSCEGPERFPERRPRDPRRDRGRRSVALRRRALPDVRPLRRGAKVRVEVIDRSDAGGSGGSRRSRRSWRARGPFSRLKYEGGVHRVQRVPPRRPRAGSTRRPPRWRSCRRPRTST